MKTGDTCAMCGRFTLKGYESQAAEGMGYCTGYERMTQWDWASVLFVRAPNQEQSARRAFITKHETKGSA